MEAIEKFFQTIFDVLLSGLSKLLQNWWGWVSADLLTHMLPRLAISILVILLFPITYKLIRFILKKRDQ